MVERRDQVLISFVALTAAPFPLARAVDEQAFLWASQAYPAVA
jgi:hypothetical protein